MKQVQKIDPLNLQCAMLGEETWAILEQETGALELLALAEVEKWNGYEVVEKIATIMENAHQGLGSDIALLRILQ
jgi:hypothetical protein